VWASNAAEGAAPNFQLLQTFPQASDVFGGRQPAKQADEHTPLVSICGCADAAGQPVLLASQNDSKVTTTARCTRLRIVNDFRVRHGVRQRMALERWTNPKRSRRTCTL
jgi:hypothetical protein